MIIDPYTWNRLPLQRLELITPETLSVILPRPQGYKYQPGQYGVLRVPVHPGGVLRQYSFASCPNDDFLEILVQREPRGIVSTWFHETAQFGDQIELSQPLGGFTSPPNEQPLLLIAGQVGIAPFLGIIRDHLAQASDRPIKLLYSARGQEQFCYPELLQTIETKLYDTGNGSRLTQDELASHLQARPSIMLCGSKQFVDSLYAQLIALGTPTTDIKRELFTLQ